MEVQQYKTGARGAAPVESLHRGAACLGDAGRQESGQPASDASSAGSRSLPSRGQSACRCQLLPRKVSHEGHHAGRGVGLLPGGGYIGRPPAGKPAAVDAAHRDATAGLWLAVRHAAAVHQRRVVPVHLQRDEGRPEGQVGRGTAAGLTSSEREGGSNLQRSKLRGCTAAHLVPSPF